MKKHLSFGIVELPISTIQNERGASLPMIAHDDLNNQLPSEFNAVFQELRVAYHLRKAGITKRFGFSCLHLFRIVFSLIFHHRNWFQLLESARGSSFPGKDAVYRFLNHPRFSWRRFLTSFSAEAVSKTKALTTSQRVNVLIVDDSTFSRNRSKAVELLARFWDHAEQCYYKGFRMLTLGWSDGHTFLPLDFSLLSSTKSQLQGISNDIDKRTSGFQRRKEALLPAPQVIPAMLDRAMAAGVSASYVLMDTWFTFAPLIQKVLDTGMDVIGMVKAGNQRYRFEGKRLTLKELYYAATPAGTLNKSILRSVRAELIPGIPITMVFVRHRSKKNEWLAILSTDTTLTVEEIIQIYGIRWDIEVFFKCTKSLLQLQKEFQGRSYDMMISHTTVVFSRYILLAWQHRISTDQRTLGGLFLALCDEVAALDWAAALKQLVEIINEVAGKANRRLSKLIRRQLQKWINGLPSYIKVYLPISVCES